MPRSLKNIVTLAIVMGLIFSIPAAGHEKPLFAQSDTAGTGKYRQPIVIATITALTGRASEINRVLNDGAQFAVDELNLKGGILGHKIKLLKFNNKSNSLGSQDAARKAVKAKAMAVVGPPRSSHALAAAQILQDAGIPMISPEATNPKVTLVGNYIFRMVFLDTFQATVIAQFVYKDLGARTAVLFTNVNRVFSIGLSDYFTEAFHALGGKILWNGDYLDEAADYKRLIRNAKKLKPDIIFIPSEVRDAGFIIRQALKMGLKCQFVGPDSWSERMYEVAGNSAEGGYYSTYWHRNVDREKSRRFVSKYEKAKGPLPRTLVPLAYDTVMLFADAIERAGSANRKKIRDALAATSEFKGVTGPISFDANGDPINKPAVILQLRKGQAEYVKTVLPVSKTLVEKEKN
ncbi:MAG: ABC transporter substrate-binding protein [Desulfobacteraceae bacterium]|nr:ABC transporter substrate-binding protein [Desulfobacteraceae bacterium]